MKNNEWVKRCVAVVKTFTEKELVHDIREAERIRREGFAVTEKEDRYLGILRAELARR